MATTNYYSIDGIIIGEETAGVMRNYGTDALGSVVETVLNGVEENTYQYKPYGGQLAKTGTAADPSFLWNGGSGYRATKLTNSEYYVRRRVMSSTTAQWTTVDLLWPRQAAYGYVVANPMGMTDVTGMGPWTNPTGNSPDTSRGWNEAYARTHSTFAHYGVSATIQLPLFCDTCDDSYASFFTFYLSFWKHGNPSLKIKSGTVVDCGVSLTCPRGWRKIGNAATIAAEDTYSCGECLPGAKINIALNLVGTQWHCEVNNHLFVIPAGANAQPMAVDMSMGAGWNFGDQEPQHTTATWSAVSTQDTPSGAWNPWNSVVAGTSAPTYYLNPSRDIMGGYAVTQKFPLIAYLTNNFVPGQACMCPTKATPPPGTGTAGVNPNNP